MKKRIIAGVIICLFVSLLPAFSEAATATSFDATKINSLNKTYSWYSNSEDRALLTVLLGYSIMEQEDENTHDLIHDMLENNTYVGEEKGEVSGDSLVVVGIAKGQIIIIYYSPENGFAHYYTLVASTGQSAEFVIHYLCGDRYYLNNNDEIQTQKAWVEDHYSGLTMAYENSHSDLVEFRSTMMESVSSQINEATDLTITSDKRAILAALLSLEFVNQKTDFTIDYTLPIYACKQGKIASVAVGGEDNYALIIYQMNPLATSYGILYGNNPTVIRATLEATNESVWQVPINVYNEKLSELVSQLQ